MKAVVIKTDGTTAEIDGGYESIKAALDGWLEIAPLPSAFFIMLCDEEGKLKGKPFNQRANDLANRYRSWDDPLVGDVVLTGPVDRSGNHTEFTLADLVDAERPGGTVVPDGTVVDPLGNFVGIDQPAAARKR